MQKLYATEYVESPVLPVRKRMARLRYDRIYGILLISPWLVGLLLFKILPILASLVISFTDFYMLEPDNIHFVGLQNYVRLLNDQAVGYVLFETIALALFTIPLQMIASIFLAGLLSSPRLKGRTALRTFYFLPSIIPSVAIMFMWFGFVDPATGWLNKLILQPLGLAGSNGMYVEGLTNLLFAVNSLWSIGPGMLIMLGALQGIPQEIMEAARVDGAGPIVRFFSITLPLISPAVFFSLVINLITVFGGVVLLDRGNVFSGSISPYDGYVSNILFREFELGYASSLAWFFLILVMIIIVALFASSKRWVYYSDRGGQA
jgi:ABC-type sugar transport system permease subunit